LAESDIFRLPGITVHCHRTLRDKRPPLARTLDKEQESYRQTSRIAYGPDQHYQCCEIMPYKFWHLFSVGISQQMFILFSVPVWQESPHIAFPIGPRLLEEVISAAKSSKGMAAARAPGPHE